MNRLDTQSQNVLLAPSHASLPKPVAARRLIVLIPANIDCSTITRRIWKLADESKSTVQLLALYKDPDQEPTLRRELVTISALIQDANVPVEIRIEKGTNWVDAIKRTYQDGDMVVCLAEQPVGIQRKPLSQILESDLKIPVYYFSDLPVVKPESPRIAQATIWLGFLGIIAGFFMLQLKVLQLPNDFFQTTLLIILLILEFWLLWAWNSLFS